MLIQDRNYNTHKKCFNGNFGIGCSRGVCERGNQQDEEQLREFEQNLKKKKEILTRENIRMRKLEQELQDQKEQKDRAIIERNRAQERVEEKRKILSKLYSEMNELMEKINN